MVPGSVVAVARSAAKSGCVVVVGICSLLRGLNCRRVIATEEVNSNRRADESVSNHQRFAVMRNHIADERQTIVSAVAISFDYQRLADANARSGSSRTNLQRRDS